MGDSLLMECAATMGVAMVPVLELRGAIPFGLALGLSPGLAYLVSVIGNLIPIPAVMLLIRTIFRWLCRWPWWESKVRWLERRAENKGEVVRKYSILGLILLVAIPLPGTGAWTGALVAAFLDIRLKKAVPAIFAGVCTAAAITTVLTFGAIHIF